ncbi:MAG: PH domain-containing protein [Gammaproteobacteria bacterium]|nr:PH domain-containing protein [Gammaproteobacteria bacterium]
MSEVLYEAHPSMIRMYPFGTVLAILLIPLGIGILVLLWWWLTTKADKLTIKTDEIVWEHGLINKQYTEINMSSLRSVRVNQSLLQRILSAGNVEVYTAGDEPELVIKGMPNPDKIREFIKGQGAD